jgi:hypothetical protein
MIRDHRQAEVPIGALPRVATLKSMETAIQQLHQQGILSIYRLHYVVPTQPTPTKKVAEGETG